MIFLPAARKKKKKLLEKSWLQSIFHPGHAAKHDFNTSFLELEAIVIINAQIWTEPSTSCNDGGPASQQ